MNRKKTEYVEINGKTFKTKSELCRYYGVSISTYSYRRSKGLSLESSLRAKFAQKQQIQKRFTKIIKNPDMIFI